MAIVGWFKKNTFKRQSGKRLNEMNMDVALAEWRIPTVNESVIVTPFMVESLEKFFFLI